MKLLYILAVFELIQDLDFFRILEFVLVETLENELHFLFLVEG